VKKTGSLFVAIILLSFGRGYCIEQNDKDTTLIPDTSLLAAQSDSIEIDSFFLDSLDALGANLDSLDSMSSSAIITEDFEPEPYLERQGATLRNKRTHGWVLIMALFILILIGSLRALDSTRYFYALRTPFRSLKSEVSFFELIPGIDVFQIVFILIYVLTISFALHIYRPFDLKLTCESDWRNYLVLVLIVVAIYTLKYALYYLIFQILLTEKLPKMMVVSMSNLGFLFALITFPLLMIVYYSLNDVLRSYLGIGFAILLALFFAYRFFRLLFLTWPTFQFNRVYIFIYLCTLEILPLLFVAKWVGLLG